MKRDYELIKRILAAIEEKDKGENHIFTKVTLGLSDVGDAEFSYNAVKMYEAGLIKAAILHADNLTRIHPITLTNAGHDFLDSARSPKVWEKFLKKLAEMGGSVAMEVAKDLLIQLAKTTLLGGS